MSLRVGIISANWGAFAHLPAWRAVPGVEVTAICTSRQETAETAAAKHGIPRAFWDAEAMCADPDIDIIDCGTRPSIREAHVLAALRHGKHVYNAIPFARDFAGARTIHAAWQAAGTVAVTDAFSEWVPALRLAKEMVDEGFLGRPFGGTCWFNMPLYNPMRPGFPYNWFAEDGMGVSAVRNLGSQMLNMLLPLFGPIAELVAIDERKIDRWTTLDGGEGIDARTNDFAGALLRFESGLVMQMQICWNATAGPGWWLEAYGADGRIVTQAPSFPTSRDTTISAGRRCDAAVTPLAIPDRLFRTTDLGIDADHPVAPAYPMALSMNAMARAIEGEGNAHPDFEQAWQVERTQEAIRISNAERRWVTLAEIV